MYIRRKVFSLLQDENGEERYFSTTEFTDERLYAEKEDDEKSGKGKKAAIIGGAAAAPVAVAGGYQGIHAIRKHLADKGVKNAKNQPDLDKARARRGKIENEGIAKAGRKVENSIENAAKNAANWVMDTKAGKWAKNTWKGGKANDAVEAYKAEHATALSRNNQAAKEKLAKLEKKAKNAGIRNKALMIGTPIVATGGTIAATKIAKNKRKSDED